jgi:hypothetical protein
VENALWKRLWTCHKADNRMNARTNILVFGLSSDYILGSTYQTGQYCDREHNIMNLQN